MKTASIGLLALALGGAPAAAETIQQTVSANNVYGGWMTPFDAALGTLTSVNIIAVASDRRLGQAVIFDPDYAGQIRMLVEGTVGSSITGLIPYRGDSGPIPVTQADNFISVLGYGEAEFDFTGADLEQFIGTAPVYVALDKGVVQPASFVLPPDFPGFAVELPPCFACLAVDHLITFDYVAAPVPEPASWAMMIAGLGLVGAALRRRSYRTCVTMNA